MSQRPVSFFFFFFWLFRATSMAYGGSQARGQIGSCSHQPQPCQIWALSATYTTAHDSAGYFNPLIKARDQTCILTDASQICFHWATWVLPKILILDKPIVKRMECDWVSLPKQPEPEPPQQNKHTFIASSLIKVHLPLQAWCHLSLQISVLPELQLPSSKGIQIAETHFSSSEMGRLCKKKDNSPHLSHWYPKKYT